MKSLFPLFLLFATGAIAQSSDILLLKKRNKTLQTFYAGSNITFTATNGAYRDARIERMKNDTLYLREYITQYLPTTFGTYIVDTIGSYSYRYHYNQVAVIGKEERKNFNLKGSGASLFGGGILLILGSGAVYLFNRSKFSLPLLLASAGLATIGYFLMKPGKSGIRIGKKYKLVYLDIVPLKGKEP